MRCGLFVRRTTCFTNRIDPMSMDIARWRNSKWIHSGNVIAAAPAAKNPMWIKFMDDPNATFLKQLAANLEVVS